VERVHHEVALLQMRSEQLRFHLRSLPHASAEARKVHLFLNAMKLKIRVLKQFARQSDLVGRGRAKLH
jgi:hypothetical protein